MRNNPELIKKGFLLAGIDDALTTGLGPEDPFEDLDWIFHLLLTELLSVLHFFRIFCNPNKLYFCPKIFLVRKLFCPKLSKNSPKALCPKYFVRKYKSEIFRFPKNIAKYQGKVES